MVGSVDALKSLLHDFRDDLVLVDVFDGLGLLEDVLSSRVEVVSEGDLLRDEELPRKAGTLRRELFLMER